MSQPNQPFPQRNPKLILNNSVLGNVTPPKFNIKEISDLQFPEASIFSGSGTLFLGTIR